MNPGKRLESQVATAFYGNFVALRPLQEATIEPLLSHKNLVLTAGTGSGKTEAVLAPLISLHWREAVRSGNLIWIYLAPTKALVNDLEKRIASACRSLHLEVGIRHGDRDDLAGGKIPHLLITTPESLEVMMFRRDKILASIRVVVIDEVHLLYNTQRGLQLSILLRRLRDVIAQPLQWVALSATVGRASDIRDFLFGKEEAEFLEFSSNRKIDAVIRWMEDAGSFAALIRKLLGRPNTKILVFANTRRECERLSGILQFDDAMQSLIFTHYSSLSPEVRVEVEKRFTSYPTAVCVATSTLEMGIDIGDIDAVILWGVPGGMEAFLQRIGRGNRRANKSNVICCIPDDSENPVLDGLRFMTMISLASRGQLPLRSPYELFGAAAQQSLACIGSLNGSYTRVADLCSLVEHQKHLDRPAMEQILSTLAGQDYLQHHGFKNRYGADQRLWELVEHRMIYGNYGVGSQLVPILHFSKLLGEVPAINLLRIRVGTSVRFAGATWRVRKAGIEGIQVEPSDRRSGAIDIMYPGRTGSKFDVFVTNAIWMILCGLEKIDPNMISANIRSQIIGLIDIFSNTIGRSRIVYACYPLRFRYLTFAGYMVNRAIALITRQNDFECDDYFLSVASPIDWASIPKEPEAYQDIFHLLFEASSGQSIYQSLLPMEMQLHEFIQDWLHDETIPMVLQRLANSKTLEVEMNKFDNIFIASPFELKTNIIPADTTEDINKEENYDIEYTYIDPECHWIFELCQKNKWPFPISGFELTASNESIIAVCELAWPNNKMAVFMGDQEEFMPAFTENNWNCLLNSSDPIEQDKLIRILRDIFEQ